MATINTPAGPFEYSPIALYRGRGTINKIESAANLRILKEVLDSRGITFGIIYGTLLGAVRQNDFIDWDEDVDVFILDEQRSEFLDALWFLRDAGLELVREDGDLYSVMRNDNYIDVYFFRKVGGSMRCNSDVVPAHHMTSFGSVSFLGEEFRTPRDPVAFLEYAYGKDWRTPRENSPARPWSASKHIREFLMSRIPGLRTLKSKLLR